MIFGVKPLTGRVFSINTSSQKGVAKKMVRQAELEEGMGFSGDVHAGPGLRQVSLLSIEAIEDFESEVKVDVELGPGAFGENITTEGLDLTKLRVGDELLVGTGAVLKVTQLGKTCHAGCAITKSTGRCIMPKLGVFASVEKGGTVRIHDRIQAQQTKRTFSWLKT